MSAPRDTAPSRTAITEYWRRRAEYEYRSGDHSEAYKLRIIDYGEPSCFACGYWNPRWTTWSKADGLQRCHITPHALGGINEPSNYVLMCADCHDAAPDTLDRRFFFQWISERHINGSPFTPRQFSVAHLIADTAQAHGLDVDQLMSKAFARMDGTVPHLSDTGPALSIGTYQWALSEAVKEMTA
jgi:5-methylcytosine-specific restriction endonuclease McrA